MAVGAVNANVGVIKLLEGLRSLELLTFDPQVRDAVVFFLLVVVADLAVLAVDAGLGADLEVVHQIAISY